EAGLGAFGRFDPLSGAAPAAGAVALVDLELVVSTEPRGGAAQEGARRQPPMGDGAEREYAAVILVFVLVEGCRLLCLRLRPGGNQDGKAVLACMKPGAIGEEVEGGCD